MGLLQRGVLLHNPIGAHQSSQMHVDQCNLFMSSAGVSEDFPLSSSPKVF